MTSNPLTTLNNLSTNIIQINKNKNSQKGQNKIGQTDFATTDTKTPDLYIYI